MITLVHVLHILVCALLIGSVLLQGGENVDITAAFGGTSQAAFGPRGSVTLLAKITWVLGAIDYSSRARLESRQWNVARRRARQVSAGGSGARQEVGQTAISGQLSALSNDGDDSR
jgi:protein translocase SecG subunit